MMQPLHNLKGAVLGDGAVVVLRKAPNKDKKHSMWVCKCNFCGKKFVEYGFRLRNGQFHPCECQENKTRSRQAPRKYSKSLSRLLNEDIDPYQMLAGAIIAVAADDYRTALRDENADLQRELEDFFCSDWYRALTDIDGAFLITSLSKDSAGELLEMYI